MKFTVASIAALATMASASPLFGTRSIVKRAAVEDACDIGYATGTTGGAGGKTVTVKTLDEFIAAAEGAEPAIILVDGQISGSYRSRIGSDKSIIGLPGASLTNIGLYINKQKNVIIRNLKLSKVEATNGDAIGIQESTNVWVDHVDLSSDLSSGKDFYDGLLDITRASDFITVSNTYLHDHFKASLIGHSDSNSGQDTGKLHVTYANNHWKNTGSRNPSVRFGVAHIFNNVFDSITTSGVNTRMGAKVLVESSSFANVKNAIVSLDSSTEGTAVVKDISGATSAVGAGSFPAPDYKYELLGAANLDSVVSSAGQTLTFDGSAAPAPAPPAGDETTEPTPVESTPVEESDVATPVESAPADEKEDNTAPVESAPAGNDDDEVEEVCTRRRVKKAKRAVKAIRV